MNVLLISTYDLGRQPFGLASPAAWLRARGHQVATADVSLTPLALEPVRDAEFIAFYLPMHTATRLAAPLIERVRQVNPRARLGAYGLYAPLNAAALRALGVEVIIGGEFESALAAALDNVPPPLVSLERLDFLTPDRSSLPDLAHYAHVVHADGRRVRVGYTEASRGCKHLCRHCPVVPVYNGVFRIVPLEVVLADVRAQVAAGAGHITFGDPDFFNGPAHGRRLVEALHAEFPTVTYDVTIKVEHLLRHADLLPVLQRTGCLWVTSAVESTEDHVLQQLDKGHTRADFLHALTLMRAAGLNLAPTFVPFTPWTTQAGYRDLLSVVRDHGLIDCIPPIQLALRLLIPHGSLILDIPSVRPYIESFDSAALLHRWRHPEPAVDAMARQVFTLVASAQKSRTPRRTVFAQLWRAANSGVFPENFELVSPATIPYLEEPWYC